MKVVVFSTYAIQFDLKMTTLIRYDYNNVLLGFAINIYYENLRSKRTQDRNQNWTRFPIPGIMSASVSFKSGQH